MFTTGLGYFTSLYDDSGKTDTSDEANLPATAGMELSVFGVHIRPFVMFTSQGQLMGHVWAGTGSDRTPIIQVCVIFYFSDGIYAVKEIRHVVFGIFVPNSFLSLLCREYLKLWNILSTCR